MPLLAAAAEVEKIPQIKGKAAAGLRNFVRIMRSCKHTSKMLPDEVIRQVIEKSGYRAMLKNSGDEDDQERLANVEELITAARQFAAEDSSQTIGDFLEQITLASDVDGWDEQQDCVSVMTLHAAKGLEFPVVYMLAVEQGLLPHERSLSNDQDDLEEERRLCFVGMTRAKQELYLCHAQLRRLSRAGAICGGQHVSGRIAARHGRDPGPDASQRRLAVGRLLAGRIGRCRRRLGRRRISAAAIGEAR